MSGTTTAALIPKRSDVFRLLLVTPRYPPFTGGIELHVHEVARRMVQRGVHVDVITTDPTGELREHELAEGVAVHRVRAWPRQRDYYFAPALYRKITNGRWDVVHVHSYLTFAGPLAMLAAARARLPYVVTFHAGGLAAISTPAAVLPHVVGSRAGSAASRFRYSIRPVQLEVVRPLLRRADRLIALAPFEVEVFSKRLGVPRERFAVISNGSDLPRPTGSPPENEALIASIGRLEPYKGHHRVVSALPHVVRRCPTARLWIAGTGPCEDALRGLADRLGVGERVDIHAIPPDQRQRMADELGRAQVVTLLSDFEGARPLAALEALHVGCRLIVSDVPGLSDLAADRLARALPVESTPEALAAAILEELALPRQVPLDLPTWDDCADALHEVYRSVVRANQRLR